VGRLSLGRLVILRDGVLIEAALIAFLIRTHSRAPLTRSWRRFPIEPCDLDVDGAGAPSTGTAKRRG
jgi:hypothetical protein